MPSGRYHWPPRVGDWVYQESRSWPHGQIVFIEKDWSDPDNGQALVKFECKIIPFRMPLNEPELAYGESLFWSLLNVPRGWIMVDGKLEDYDPAKFNYIQFDEPKPEPSTELATIYFDEFQGNWSSRDGGNNRWEIV